MLIAVYYVVSNGIARVQRTANRKAANVALMKRRVCMKPENGIAK